MKLNRWLGVLLLILLSPIIPSSGQQTDVERKQFDAIKAKADKGDPEAQLSLYYHYMNGDIVSRDPGKALKWLRKAADLGSAHAQCRLGLAYNSGEGVKPDKYEAARWLRRAADQDLAEAQFDLGMCYANGDGVPRNPVEAVALYRKAAEQALPEAESELGSCYLEGTGVPKDIPDGIRWIFRAANQGFARAQNTLGECYVKGTGVPKDYLQAYKWFNLAASKGGQLADDAKINLASAERYLTTEQVAEAQRLTREFVPHKLTAEEEAAFLPPKRPRRRQSAEPEIRRHTASGAPAETSKRGIVNVKADDDAYEIYVDGAFVGNTPAKVKLVEGEHLVEVKRAGFKDYRKQIRISDGSELTLRAVLEKQ